MGYIDFISKKSQLGTSSGFDPVWMPRFLFDFQEHLCEWAIRRGRAAIFAECGMGKTAIQLVWAQNIVQRTNKPVVIFTPIAVGKQTIREGIKFGIDAVKLPVSGPSKPTIYVTNYEKQHHFSPDDFAGVVCDESGMLKNVDAARRDQMIEFMRTTKYRLLCSATPAPNDYVELGNSSEALGEMGFHDMLTMFFKQDIAKDWLGWGRIKYRLRGHAEREFWRWVCSWGRAIRKPSDLGFNDSNFILPSLCTNEHIVKAGTTRKDMLFDVPAITLQEQRDERRRSIKERCELAAELISKYDSNSVAWCALNDEGDLLEEIIPNSIQLSGADTEEEKEEKLERFITEKCTLISKPRLTAFGLNWQHCSHQTFFVSHSFEEWYQAVRRSWRFGQKNPVTIDMIASEGERVVLENLRRKQERADKMFAILVDLMNNELKIQRSVNFTKEMEIPSWLLSIRSNRRNIQSGMETASK